MKPCDVGGASHASSGPGFDDARRAREAVGEDLVEDGVPDPRRRIGSDRLSLVGHHGVRPVRPRASTDFNP